MRLHSSTALDDIKFYASAIHVYLVCTIIIINMKLI
jgi:hypothetical protein